MISLLLILPYLVQLCLSHLLIMLILRMMKAKTKIASENLDKDKSILGAPPKVERKRLETLGLKGKTIKSLNKRSRISVITVELQGIPVQIFTSG